MYGAVWQYLAISKIALASTFERFADARCCINGWRQPSFFLGKGPDLISQPFAELLKLPAIIEACTRMLGTNNIRLGNCKLNVKPKDGGSAVHWHQDWAHYPHTNDSLLACTNPPFIIRNNVITIIDINNTRKETCHRGRDCGAHRYRLHLADYRCLCHGRVILLIAIGLWM